MYFCWKFMAFVFQSIMLHRFQRLCNKIVTMFTPPHHPLDFLTTLKKRSLCWILVGLYFYSFSYVSTCLFAWASSAVLIRITTCRCFAETVFVFLSWLVITLATIWCCVCVHVWVCMCVCVCTVTVITRSIVDLSCLGVII